MVSTRTSSSLLVCALLIPAVMPTSATSGDLIPPPTDRPAVVMSMLLEKTIFQVDVLTLDLWLGPDTFRRLAPLLPLPAAAAVRDTAAVVALNSRDAWATLVFRRGVRLDQFLGGIDENMRRARDAGHLDPAGYTRVASELPDAFAPLAVRGIEEGDRLFYRIRGDTLRTVYRQHDGRVVIDQIDVGPERRLSLLGSFFVTGSEFRRGLLDSLQPVAGEETGAQRANGE